MTTDEKPKWTIRRRIICVTLAFCAAAVVYCLWQAEDLQIYDTTIVMSYMLAGSVIGSYVFGATYESIKMKK